MHLFQIVDLYDEIYKWFNILIDRHHQLAGFVIMPNHVHMLVHITQGEDSVNSILANGKRFLAYEIVKRLNKDGREDILSILASRVTPEEAKRKRNTECLKSLLTSNRATQKNS